MAEQEMIDHSQIPLRYKGWVRLDRPETKVMEKVFPGCVQYWHAELKQSLLFDNTQNNFVDVGTGGKMFHVLLLGPWEDFEDCCKRCGINLEISND